jgi:hypothetical protein
METITITPELHEALLAAIDIVSDAISMTDLARFPYMGESLGDVRDLLGLLATGNLEVFA